MSSAEADVPYGIWENKSLVQRDADRHDGACTWRWPAPRREGVRPTITCEGAAATDERDEAPSPDAGALRISPPGRRSLATAAERYGVIRIESPPSNESVAPIAEEAHFRDHQGKLDRHVP